MSNQPSRIRPTHRAWLDDDPRAASDGGTPSAFQRLAGMFGKARAAGAAPAGRRRPTPADDSAKYMCIDLRTRLMGLSHDRAMHVMKQLVLVHDKLARRGWPGVGALPGRVLARAVLQAEILHSEDPSPTLELFLDRLRQTHAAAAQRDTDDATIHEIRIGQNLEVSESTHAEFDDMERGWAGTVPSDLAPLDGDSGYTQPTR